MNFFKSSGFLCAILILCMIGGAASCSDDGLEETTLSINDMELIVEVARTDEERARGLMYREEMGRFDGMLFLFDEDRHLSFWMKNTVMPLSIAYIARDGTIREIYDMEPGSLEPVVSVRSVRYALEVPRGFFQDRGIKPGDMVWFEKGFEP